MNIGPLVYHTCVRLDNRVTLSIRSFAQGAGPGALKMKDQTGDAVKERVKVEKKEPAQYKVVLLNDDYTTMEFVVQVLESVFQKSPAEAFRIMMHVHQNGSGIAGVYPWEVAETKVETVTSLARHAEFPLRATIEEA
jgi:ATP-dependent Clp protease adaptor protein ClpS